MYVIMLMKKIGKLNLPCSKCIAPLFGEGCPEFSSVGEAIEQLERWKVIAKEAFENAEFTLNTFIRATEE